MFRRKDSTGKDGKKEKSQQTVQLHHEPDFKLKAEQNVYTCNQIFHILTLAQEAIPNITSMAFREATDSEAVTAFETSVLPLLVQPQFDRDAVMKALALIHEKYSAEQLNNAWARLIKKTFQQGNVFNLNNQPLSGQFSALWKILLMQLQTRLIKDIKHYKKRYAEKWWEEYRKNDTLQTVDLLGIRPLLFSFLGELIRIDPLSAKTIYLFLVTTKTISEHEDKYNSAILYSNCALISPCLLDGLCLSGRIFSQSMKDIHFAQEVTSPALEAQFMRRVAYAVVSIVMLGKKHGLEDIAALYTPAAFDTQALQAAPKGFTPSRDASEQVVKKVASDPDLESKLLALSVSNYETNTMGSPPVARRNSNSN